MKLNKRQKAFIKAFCGNATEAAIKAGYAPRSARVHGARLLTNDNIVKAIAEREEIENRESIATRQARQKFWTEVMKDAKQEMKERLRASELLGKSEGDFVDRTELSTPKGLQIMVSYENGAEDDESDNRDNG